MSADYAQMIEGCRRRQAASQRALYNEVASMAMGICMRYAGNREDANDMMQEAMIKVFERVGRIKQAETLRAWVARTVVNTCIDTLRQRHWMRLSDNEELDVGQIEMDPFGVEEIVAALQQLPPQQRLVFNLCEVEGYERSEVAQQLKCSEVNVRVQLSRAKAQLRTILENKAK